MWAPPWFWDLTKSPLPVAVRDWSLVCYLVCSYSAALDEEAAIRFAWKGALSIAARFSREGSRSSADPRRQGTGTPQVLPLEGHRDLVGAVQGRSRFADLVGVAARDRLAEVVGVGGAEDRLDLAAVAVDVETRATGAAPGPRQVDLPSGLGLAGGQVDGGDRKEPQHGGGSASVVRHRQPNRVGTRQDVGVRGLDSAAVRPVTEVPAVNRAC